MSERERSVPCPSFNGKDEAFQVWWTKFRAFATTKGFVNALLSREQDLPPTENANLDEENETDKAKIKARARNSLAMAYLLSAFKAEADISLAYETMDDDWPGGLAYKVVEKMMEIYKPQDTVTEVEVYEKLMRVKMKKKEDPKTLFEQVSAIANWYNSSSRKLPKEQLIAVVLQAAPNEYASVLNAEQEKRGKDLELSHLRAVMNRYYRTVYKKKKSDDDEDDEVQLVGTDGKRGIKCYNCGEMGHIAKNCSKKSKNNNNQKGKFNGTCNLCGKRGHKVNDCWDNPKNEEKRPAWYKKAEVAAAHEVKSEEVQLMNFHWDQYADAFEDEVSESEYEVDKIQEILIKNDENGEKQDEADHVLALQVNRNKMKPETKKIKTNMKISLMEDPEIFILDTGASTNSTGNTQGVTNMRNAQGSVTKVGNGQVIHTKYIGTLKGVICDKNGNELHTVSVNDIHVNPGSPFNIISGNKLLMMGYSLSGNKESGYEYSKKNSPTLKFDIKIKTPKGILFAMRIKRKSTLEEMQVLGPRVKKVTIMEAHKQLGHMDEATTRKAAAQLGWIITRGGMKICESCAKAKAKQKKIKTQEPHEKSDDVNGRVYLDLSRIKGPEHDLQPRRPNWRLIVDEKTAFKISHFYETKDGMIEPTCQLFKEYQGKEKEVKILRMDNAGENKELVKQLNSKKWQLYPKIEWTARDTPQQNHLVEVGFTTLYGRGRALMIEAKVPKNKRHIVGQKAFETATKLDGLIPTTINGTTKTRAEHFGNEIPSFVNHMRKWGEAGIVKIRTKTTPKMDDRGITCMFVGYPDNHSGDAYEMLNWNTKRVLVTRDIIWLNRMYFTDQEQDNTDVVDDGYEAGEHQKRRKSDKTADTNKYQEAPDRDQESEEERDDEGDAETTTMTRSGRIVRPPNRLIEEDELTEIMTVGAGIGGGFSHTSDLIPMKYEEAMQKDPKGWKESVDKEHQRMVDHKVFKPVKKDDLPENAKILTSTWAMKLKADGTKRARINARGFEQRPGEHYAEDGISSPVVNEASIFLILILIIMAGMYVELNDVKGAFLNGLFSKGEKLYMHVPQGFEQFYPKGIVLLLLKTIYGLKQAAFEYWQALLKAIRAIGLKRSKADPCVYYRWTQNGLNIWCSWVDDIMSCGHKNDVDEGREALKQFFDLDEVGELKEYVGCKVEYNREKGYMKLTQPVLIQSFEDEFELPSQVYKTPAAPGNILVSGDVILNEQEHRLYRKGVGKLIHLSKYSKPGILNAVRELSRFGAKPTKAHLKELLRCMKYCMDTKEKGLMLKPNKKWNGSKDFEFEITGDSDSNFATCPETRRSVSGWSAKLNGAPYTRKSKMQKFVTLSVTEAECVAATSCVQDMLFGKRFLESLGLKVKLPMTLYMDNKGGVDIFNNWSIAGNTRAVSTRFAYIRELKEEGILEIKWKSGNDNNADIFTKNLDATTYEKHEQVYSGE